MNSIILITLVLSIYESSFKNDHQWIAYKNEHSKVYRNHIEELQRYSNFRMNDEKIKTHNKQFERGEVGYTMDHNEFSDMTFDEFSRTYLSGLNLVENVTYQTRNFSLKAVPESLSYQDYCLPPLRQGSCSSCWAFAAAAQVEVQLRMKYPQFNQYLSPQYLLDCSDGGSCSGGSTGIAQTYMKDHGMVLNNDYKYVGYQQTCKSHVQKLVMKLSSNYAEMVYGNERVLRYYLADFGPVVIFITVTPKFLSYKSNIFWDDSCPSSCVMNEMDHAILLVGYGSETVNGQNIGYWVLKNSWGPNWGESGYIRMRRNYKNNCNVACIADFAVVKKASEME